MKKLMILAACLVLATGLSAQEKWFHWGFKGGVNVANVSGEADMSMKPSFYAGGFAEFKLSKNFGLSPELLYSRQGYRATLDGSKAWVRYNYLNMPMLAKFYIGERLSIDVGPQIGFALNGKVKVKSVAEGDSSTQTATIDSDLYNKFDLSIAAGANYYFDCGVFASARYIYGLTDIEKAATLQNRVLQLGVGYRF